MKLTIEEQTDWVMSDDASDFMKNYYEKQVELRKELDGCDTAFCLDSPSCVCGASK